MHYSVVVNIMKYYRHDRDLNLDRCSEIKHANHYTIGPVEHGEDGAKKFVQKLQLEAQQLCDEYIATPKPPILTMQLAYGILSGVRR